ncbi:ATP-binding cassette domain-containing protein, partial [Escherichia coli]|uniref:ATP-binding cassette domain-containing protein n=1 Tax=Escherichia coli TaxID=562 RepID=UPI00228075FD
MKAMQVTDELFTHPLPADKYRQQTDPVLQLDNVNVSFDGFRALTDLSLRIGVGELRCVIGPNGAGKTTSFYMIVGLVPADAGRIEIDGSVITAMPIHKRARMGLSYLP